METARYVYKQGIKYIKKLRLPSISRFWPFSKRESFEEDVVEDEEVIEEDAEVLEEEVEEEVAEDTEEATEEGTGSSFFSTTGMNPMVAIVINIILIALYYIFIFILASIVANDYIRSHWLIRLYAFIFVLILCYYTSLGVYPITTYYSLKALYNVYRNYRDKPLDPEALKLWHPRTILPLRYCFLPLMTTRSQGILDMLNPFSYFAKGEDPQDPVYANYKYESKKYITKINSRIPGFTELKGMYLGTLLKKFSRFFYEINESYLKKEPQDEEEVPIKDDLNLKDTLKGAFAGATDNPIEFVQKTLGPMPVPMTPVSATATAT
jgi:hypothetical protein